MNMKENQVQITNNDITCLSVIKTRADTIANIVSNNITNTVQKTTDKTRKLSDIFLVNRRVDSLDGLR